MGWHGHAQSGSERGAKEKEARLLSSYNNNSNIPRCGTGQLRDAW